MGLTLLTIFDPNDKRVAHFLPVGGSSGVEVKRGVVGHCGIRSVEGAYERAKSG